MIIGVLSDTHGSLHERVVPVFEEAGVELILHAGDVGSYSIIEALSKLARVQAVCGNVDVEGNVALLPAELQLEIQGVRVYMTHIGGKPAVWYPRLAPKPDVAICGHSHAPLLERVGPTLFLNPGAAGTQRRFSIPLSAALLRVEDGNVEAELVQLD